VTALATPISTVQAFLAAYGPAEHTFADVARGWIAQEVGALLEQLEASGEPPGPKVQAAFMALTREDLPTAAQMRECLPAWLELQGATLFERRDNAVATLVSALHGRVGELMVTRESGGAVHLSGEARAGWDLAVKQSDGTFDYVQVDLSEPAAVVRSMQEAERRIAAQELRGVGGAPVAHVDFAVPAAMVPAVRELTASLPSLESIGIRELPVTTDDVVDMVAGGLPVVAPDQLAALVDGLFGGTVIVTSLHAVVQGFLWYKGAKNYDAAIADAVGSIALGSAGLAVGFAATAALNSVVLSTGVGAVVHTVLATAAHSRWRFADAMERSIAATQGHIEAMARG